MSLADLVKKQPEGKEVKRYTGVCPFVVAAINPTKAELEALGINSKEEPTYKGDKDGVATLRVDFWLSNPMVTYKDPETGEMVKDSFLTKHSLWLENTKVKKSEAGNLQFINDYNQSTWSPSLETLMSNEKLEWFQKEGIREAFTGEVALYDIIWKWMGLGQKNEDGKHTKLQLSKSISDIIKSGSVSEIKDLVKVCIDRGNGLKFLCGVTEKDGKFYQTTYGKYIMTRGTKNYDKLNEELSKQYGAFKANYQNSLEFKLFTNTVTTAPTEFTVTKPVASPF